jgi:hypothetical protein
MTWGELWDYLKKEMGKSRVQDSLKVDDEDLLS